MKNPGSAELVMAAHEAARACIAVSEEVALSHGQMWQMAEAGKRPTQAVFKRMEAAAEAVEPAIEEAERLIPLARPFFVVGWRQGAVQQSGRWGASAHDAAVEVAKRFRSIGWTEKLWMEAMRKAWVTKEKRLDPHKLQQFMQSHSMMNTEHRTAPIDYKTEHEAELELEQTFAYFNLEERATRMRAAMRGEARVPEDDKPELSMLQVRILRVMSNRRMTAEQIAAALKVGFNTSFQNSCTDLRKRGYLGNQRTPKPGYYMTEMGRAALKLVTSAS